MQGLIIENISNLYKVRCEDKVYEANARGKLKSDEISPVVGDYVEFNILEESKKTAIIENVLERKNYIKRPKLANITNLILVISSKDPKPDLYMLDKQLAFAELLKIKVIIVLNKTDLDKKQEFANIKELYESIGYKVIITEAKSGLGIDTLKEKLKNEVSAFSGNSGVGKSTIINQIFKKEITQEGAISKKNKRGKNTTTISKIYEIEENTFIIDTPGFSSFDINEIESKDLYKYFIDLKKYEKNCMFVGCSHIKESDCGIKKAVEENIISKERYDRYCRIYNELKEKEERKW